MVGSGSKLSVSGAALAEQNWLVTPDEVKQEAVWEENNPAARTFRTRAFLEDSPDIILVTPVSLLETAEGALSDSCFLQGQGWGDRQTGKFFASFTAS